MGQLKNITDITSDVAATLGIGALTNATRYVAHASELPEGSSSSAYLVQSNPASVLSFRLDPTSSTGSPFFSGATYHRISFWVKLMKYDQEVTTAPTSHQVASHQFSFAGNNATAVPTLVWVTPDSNSSRYTGNLGGFILANPVGSFGTEGNIQHLAGGCSYSSDGTLTLQTSNYAAPNFPIETWVRVDLLADLSTLRYKILINGQLTSVISLKVSTNPCVDWTVNLPVITGFRWALERMSSWADTSAANDTGITAVTDSKNWKAWSIPPTFAKLQDIHARVSYATPTNGAWVMTPYSIATGNDPQRLAAVFTASGSSASAGFTYGGQPMAFNADGVFVVDMYFRLGQADTSSGTAGQGVGLTMQFNGLNPSFTVAYTGGHYVLTDGAGNTIGSWDLNEIVNLKLAIFNTGAVYATLINQSKNSTTTSGFSKLVTLAVTDAAPTTTFTLVGAVTSSASGGKFAIEALSGFTRDVVLLTDSFTEAPNQGATAYVVSTWTSAYRASLNKTALLAVVNGQSDPNVSGGCVLPYGPNMPRVCVSGTWGRSGCKITDFDANNISNGALDNWYGTDVCVFGGITNDLSSITDSTTAAAVARSIADSFVRIARHRLDRKAGFTWIRMGIPPRRPDQTGTGYPNGLPGAAFETQYKRLGYFLAVAYITADLTTLMRTHPRGDKCAILDAGAPDFDDLTTGVHPGIPGSQAAFVAALQQWAAHYGLSYVASGGTAAPRSVLQSLPALRNRAS